MKASFIRVVSVVLLFACTVLNAAPTRTALDLDQHSKQIFAGHFTQYLEDPKNNITISDLLSNQYYWLASHQEVPNFSFTKSAYWFKLPIRNLSSSNSRWMLEIAYPLLDEIDLYLVRHNQIVSEFHTGDEQNFYSRPVAHRNFVFPMTLEQKDSAHIYIRLKSNDTIQLPIVFWEEKTFIEESQKTLLSQGFYFGIMFIMVMYNLFIFTSVRDNSYIYYVGYITFFSLFQAAQAGLLYQYFWTESPYWNRISMLVFTSTTIAIAGLFVRDFLDLKDNKSWYTPLLAIVAGAGFVGIFASFVIPYFTMIKILVLLGLAVVTSAFCASFHQWSLGSVSAKYFSIAFAVLLVGVAMLILNKLGVIPRNTVTESSAQIGAVVEAFLLSLALGDRINRERKKRYTAQEKVLQEIREREKAERELLYRNVYDELTGCPNKTLLQQKFSSFSASERGKSCYLVLIYLHRFQEINNTLGHHNGDELVRRVTLRLSNTLKAFDSVIDLSIDDKKVAKLAVIEGITFGMLVREDRQMSPEDLVRALVDCLSFPFEYHGMPLDIYASVGVSKYPNDAEDFNSLLRHARVAVELAQQKDQNFCTYTSDLDPYSSRRLMLVGELRRAIHTDELELFFQPQLDLSDETVIGAEALLRWHHPTHGLIPPDEFIPVAEQTGLIKPLTAWVLERALEQCAKFWEKGLCLRMSVNLSAKNLQEPGLPEFVRDLIQHHRLPPSYLVLEITETAMMLDPNQALITLNKLHDLGVYLSIDDFGTGYSSLAYIKQLPVQEIKIDRSFVMEMTQGNDDAVIVNTTLNMSHNLGLKVVAEGVESDEILRTLKLMGCDAVQGYYLTRPIKASEFEQWVESSGYRIAGIDSVEQSSRL